MSKPDQVELEQVELEQVERERLRALVDADIDRAAQLFAEDFQLVTPSGRTLSKTEYLEAVRTREIPYSSWEAGEIEIRAYGDAAVIRYPAEMAFDVDGAVTRPRRLWHTDLYERRDGHWQVVWSQATRIDEG